MSEIFFSNAYIKEQMRGFSNNSHSLGIHAQLQLPSLISMQLKSARQ